MLTDLKNGAVFPTSHLLHPNPPGIFLPAASAELIGAADLILSLDWTDLAGTISAAAGHGHPATGRTISCSTDAALHNGWSNSWIGQAISDPDPDLPAFARSLGFHAVGQVRDLAALPSALAEAATAARSGLCVFVDVRVCAVE